MPKNLQAILLAGGKSSRFNTEKTKLAEKICGKEMILYPLELLEKMNIATTVVVGFQKEKIIEIIQRHHGKNITFAYQSEQIGSGNAVTVSKKIWAHDNILIINGDIPLLTQEVIEKLYTKHIQNDAQISFVTSHLPDEENDSYCRILINDTKFKIIEGSDTSIDKNSQCCISVGIYIMKRTFLERHIDQLSCNTNSGEYYLPELIEIASNSQCKIVSIPISFDLARGVNNLAELWVVEHIKRSQIISHWMNHGVRFASSLNVIIDTDVIFEPGVFVGSAAHILGKSIIKKNALIGAFSYIENSVVQENCDIKSHVVILNSTIEAGITINPFTQINNQHLTNITHHESTKKFIQTNDYSFTAAIKNITEMDSLPY